MRLLRRTAMAALVWATAASMLLAASPHYACRCPDGSIKNDGFASTAPSSCCTSPNGFQKRKKSCCKATKEPAKRSCCNNAEIPTAKQASDAGPTIEQTHCQRTLVKPEDRSFCRVEVKPNGNTQDTSAVRVDVAIAPDANAAHSATPWRFDTIPPPTDLVTVLHRLTI